MSTAFWIPRINITLIYFLLVESAKMAKKRPKFGALPLLNMPQKSHQNVSKPTRPLRSVVGEDSDDHLNKGKTACYKNFPDFCKRVQVREKERTRTYKLIMLCNISLQTEFSIFSDASDTIALKEDTTSGSLQDFSIASWILIDLWHWPGLQVFLKKCSAFKNIVWAFLVGLHNPPWFNEVTSFCDSIAFLLSSLQAFKAEIACWLSDVFQFLDVLCLLCNFCKT